MTNELKKKYEMDFSPFVSFCSGFISWIISNEKFYLSKDSKENYKKMMLKMHIIEENIRFSSTKFG